MRGAAAAVTAALAAVALGGCRHADEPPVPSLIDEQAGEYGGVAMGASEADVRRAFGEPGEGDGFMPLGEEYAEIGGPPAVAVWPPGTREEPTALRYDDVAFLVGTRGVYAFIVTADGARTRRAVAIGDALAEARRTYGGGCGEGYGGEPVLGGERETYRYCRSTVDERIRIWFGRDPIRSITLARVGAAD